MGIATDMSKEREALRTIGEEQAFEAWFKMDCPVEGANAKIAAPAAWKARASRGQASSQAGEYPALVCDYCGALTPDPWHSSGMLHGKMSKHIHSCDACAGGETTGAT